MRLSQIRRFSLTAIFFLNSIDTGLSCEIIEITFFLTISVNVKKGFTRLSRSVKRKGDIITPFLHRFFKQGGSPLLYELWLISFIQDNLKPESNFPPVLRIRQPFQQRVKQEEEKKKKGRKKD
jgi:hypothetical protein